MKVLKLASICIGAIAAFGARAGQDNYQEPLNVYRADLKRTEPELVNSGFYGSVASSQAKRSVGQALAGAEQGADSQETRRAGRDRRDGGNVNVASPRIHGNVRGNVNIVIERGAIRGNITSVKR